MRLSVVIPTRWDKNMKSVVECLQSQTFKDFEVIFIVDRNLKNTWEIWRSDILSDFLTDLSQDRIWKELWLDVKFITNLNSTFRSKRDANDPRIGGNASELRNHWIKAAKGDFILLIDDDDWFEDDYLQAYISSREKYRKIVWQDFVLCPTLMYRKTGHVQNYGFSHFDYRMSRPVPAKMGVAERISVQMFSGNSLLAPAYVFKDHLFDERLDFVAEDLDFSRGLTEAGFPIIVLRDLKIYHMENDKDVLQQARVGNEYAAFRKAKHRRIYVSKYASFWDKVKFYLLGRLGQAGRLSLKVLIYGKWRPRWQIIKAIVRGTFVRLQ